MPISSSPSICYECDDLKKLLDQIRHKVFWARMNAMLEEDINVRMELAGKLLDELEAMVAK